MAQDYSNWTMVTGDVARMLKVQIVRECEAGAPLSDQIETATVVAQEPGGDTVLVALADGKTQEVTLRWDKPIRQSAPAACQPGPLALVLNWLGGRGEAAQSGRPLSC